MVFPKIKINWYHLFIYFVLLLWIIISFFNFYRRSFLDIRSFLKISKLSSLEKHALIEVRGYYNLILFCLDNIPEDKGIAFINSLQDKILPHSPVWLRGEYYIEKAPFYLHPRKIYRQINAHPGLEYKVLFNPQNGKFVLFKDKRIIYASL